MKTVKISEEVHARLTKIKGQLTAQYSASKSYDDVIQELLDKYEKKA